MLILRVVIACICAALTDMTSCLPYLSYLLKLQVSTYVNNIQVLMADARCSYSVTEVCMQAG